MCAGLRLAPHPPTQPLLACSSSPSADFHPTASPPSTPHPWRLPLPWAPGDPPPPQPQLPLRSVSPPPWAKVVCWSPKASHTPGHPTSEPVFPKSNLLLVSCQQASLCAALCWREKVSPGLMHCSCIVLSRSRAGQKARRHF